MIANYDSDDESEELNHIREKLQRKLKNDKNVTSTIHSDGSSASSEDGSMPRTVDEDDDTTGSAESREGNSSHLPQVKSKHWKSDEPMLNRDAGTNLKFNSYQNECNASNSWNDDDDDAFDAKLAAMNVLPVNQHPQRDTKNPYRTHPTQDDHILKNVPPPKSILSQRNGSSSLSNHSVINHPVVEEQYSSKNIDDVNDTLDSTKENVDPQYDNQHQAHIDAMTSSVPATNSSKTVSNKLPSCVYEVANEHTNWYDDTLSVPSVQYQFNASELINVDPFGFDIETDDTPWNNEDRGRDIMVSRARPVHSNGNSESTDNVAKESIIFKSGVLDQPFHCESGKKNFPNGNSNTWIDTDDDVLEEPRDESQYAQDGIDRLSEIDPSLYAPQEIDAIREPIVHNFSIRNRPLNCRKTIPVSQIFSPPISLLWQNKFDSFNQVQSEIANMLAYSDDNVVISAPTGAGKTAVFEMTMARFFAADLQATPPGQSDTPVISKRRKIVYIAPSKALCEERFLDWSKRLSAMNIGIEIAVVTGDGDPADALHDVATSHFILSTPEKWDSLTRRWTEKFYLFASVKLFLVDEVHLIADESRGCCLEAIVCRMKAIQRAAAQVSVTEEEIAASSYSFTSPDAVNSLLRFVAVSATLPNIADIAAFFEANEAHAFDESYRPVPLTTHVIGQGKLTADGKNGHFMFWKNLDRNVPELIIKYSNRRPSIVFCHSKADCEKLADLLATTHNIGHRDDTTSGIASQTRVSKLQRVLIHGIAYHHAGLDVDDRRLVEESFLSGSIRVLCATSTLAMGVNLPAHLVIVKGTSAYRGTGEGGGYHDIDHASLLQMIGRAGRPSYDTSGTAIIMTDNDSKFRIEKLATSGLPPAKSQLTGSKLLETINIEISHRVIVSVKSATNWIKGTLYYIQLSQNPETHGVRVVSNYSIDAYILNICQRAVDRLRSIGAVATSNGDDIYPLVCSHIMSQRLVSFSAMTAISNIPFDASHSQLLKIVSMMEGMHFPVRRSEKKALNSIHKELKMYKLEGPLSKARVQEPWQKAFILLQAYIEDFEFECFDSATRQEIYSMVDYATRMLSAIEELSLKGSMNGNVLVQCLKIRRSLSVHLWGTKDGILRQIKGIGKALAFSLSMHGISTFEDVLDHTEAQLEKAANRPPPFGSDLRKASASILRSRLVMTTSIEKGKNSLSPDIFTCVLTAKSEHSEQTNLVDKVPSVSYTLVAFTETEEGLHLAKQNIVGPDTFKCILPATFAPIHVQLIASIVGLDEAALVGEKETMKSINILPTAAITSKKRFRNATSKITSAHECQPNVKTTRSTLSLHSSTTAPKPSDVESNFGKFLDKTEQASVTPSPHLTPPSNDFRTSTAQSNTKLSCLNSRLAASISEYRNHSLMGNHAANRRKPQPPQQAHTPTFRGTSYQGMGDSVPSTDISTNMHFQSDSWKRTKQQQQKSQQRAFARHSDNPFKSFKHDPNDTESYLDQLASISNRTTPTSASIIPPEGFLAVAAARQRSHNSFRQASNGTYGTNARNISNRRKHHQVAVSMRDTLILKAAESNALNLRTTQISPNTVYPQFNGEQYAHPPFYEQIPSRSFPIEASQFRREEYTHPPFYEHFPSRSLPIEASRPSNMFGNVHGSDFPPDHTVYVPVPEINRCSNHGSDMHHSRQYTSMPAFSGNIYSIKGNDQTALQNDRRHAAADATARRDRSVRRSNVSQDDFEHAFF